MLVSGFYLSGVSMDGLGALGTSGRTETGLKLVHSGQKEPNKVFTKNLTPAIFSITVLPWLFLRMNPTSFV